MFPTQLQVSHQLGSLMDLYTTFVRLAGQDPPTDRVVDGIDLTAALINNTRTDRWVGCTIFARLTGMSSKWTLTGDQC